MFSESSRREIGASARTTSAVIVAAAFALSVVLAGCTVSAADNQPQSATSTSSPEVDVDEEPVTTTWEAPEDPVAEGPTEAPPLPEQTGDLDEVITLSTDMVVAIDAISTTTITPETPGEFAGTAVIVEVSVTNTSDAAQNIDSAVVMLVTDDGEVGVATTAGPNNALRGDVESGETVVGSYVYMLDPAQGRAVTVSVNYAAGEPIALFSGVVA